MENVILEILEEIKTSMWLIVTAGLSLFLVGSTVLNYNQHQAIRSIEVNDLKYRCIKMKGEAPQERIFELENLFEINRDNAKIRQMSKDVEDYERAIKEKATLDEQAQLRQQEAKRLNHEAEKLKKKECFFNSKQCLNSLPISFCRAQKDMGSVYFL